MMRLLDNMKKYVFLFFSIIFIELPLLLLFKGIIHDFSVFFLILTPKDLNI